MALGDRGQQPRLVGHQVEALRQQHRPRLGQLHARRRTRARPARRSSAAARSAPTRRGDPCTRGAAWLKSGTRNGLASCAWTTDCGSAVRSRTAFENGRLGLRLGLRLEPGLALHLALEPARGVGDLGVVLAAGVKSDGSRVAIWARIVARPSRRLSCVSCCVGVSASSPRTLRPLGAREQRRGLEPGALARGQLPLVDGALDLADRHREHRDDALVVPPAVLAPAFRER